MEQEIITALPQDFPWGNRIHCYDCVESTNTLAKQMASNGAPEGTVVIAAQQTGGRGRLGRSFSSPEGLGLYLSVILRPGCKAEKLMHLTCAAGLAARDAVADATGLQPGIKWANDLVVGKRKLGGILTELGFAGGEVSWAVVGVGINCRQERCHFPEALRAMATSVLLETGMALEPAALAAALLPRLEQMSRALLSPGPIMARYREHCVTLGQEISIHRGEEIFHGKALGIDDQGGLQVQYPDGKAETVTYGEVSIRGMYGYL